MKCPKCDLQVSEKAKFCNHCGEEIVGKVCPNPDCGRAGLPLDANFCPDCRMSLEAVEKTEENISIIHNSDDERITSYSSYTSGNSGLVGGHLLVMYESTESNKGLSTFATSKFSTTQSISPGESVYKKSKWEEFTDWFDWGVWWEIKHNGWKILADIAIIAIGLAIVIKYPSYAKLVGIGVVISITAIHQL